MKTTLIFEANGYAEYEVEVEGQTFEVEHTMNKYWFQGSAYASMEAVHEQITRVKDLF